MSYYDTGVFSVDKIEDSLKDSLKDKDLSKSDGKKSVLTLTDIMASFVRIK